MSAPIRHISKGLRASLQVLQKTSCIVSGNVTGVSTRCITHFPCRSFSSLSRVDSRPSIQSQNSTYPQYGQGISTLIQKLSLLDVATTSVMPTRTKVTYGRSQGRPKSVKAVTARFYRLDWGVWIRTRAGRSSHLWKKSQDRKYRLRQHVFCTKTQSKLLDRMVTENFKRKRNLVNDPYESYHERNNIDKWFPKRSKPFLP